MVLILSAENVNWYYLLLDPNQLPVTKYVNTTLSCAGPEVKKWICFMRGPCYCSNLEYLSYISTASVEGLFSYLFELD